jgi:hypothetical protein
MIKTFELKEFMEELSERCYCANWLDDLEFTLWRFVQEALKEGFLNNKEWGQGIIHSWELNKLWNLANEAGGWWVWFETDYNGNVFISLKDWIEYYEEKENKK